MALSEEELQPMGSQIKLFLFIFRELEYIYRDSFQVSEAWYALKWRAEEGLK